MSDAVPIPERIYNNTVRRLREQELEIASLVEEIDRCNRSMAEMAKMYPVVDAARALREFEDCHQDDPTPQWMRGEAILLIEALVDAVRALDGEPCPTCCGAKMDTAGDPQRWGSCPMCGGEGFGTSHISIGATGDPNGMTCPICHGSGRRGAVSYE